MDLERNIIDNILECEVKLGHADVPVTFYYPLSSLLELLNCDEEHLTTAIRKFSEREVNRLGKVEIVCTQGNRTQSEENQHGEDIKPNEGTKRRNPRYGVTIPCEGVCWVHDHFAPSEFMSGFVHEIKKPGNGVEDMIKLFQRFSTKIKAEQVSDHEWSLSFEEENIDPYVYHIECNSFGMEYHRFTHRAYEMTISNSN